MKAFIAKHKPSGCLYLGTQAGAGTLYYKIGEEAVPSKYILGLRLEIATEEFEVKDD